MELRLPLYNFLSCILDIIWVLLCYRNAGLIGTVTKNISRWEQTEKYTFNSYIGNKINIEDLPVDTRISVSTNFHSIVMNSLWIILEMFFQENVFNSTALIASCDSVIFTYFAFNSFSNCL